jgi:hypothetical protein
MNAADRAELRELIESWVIFRDGGQWERFATLWHPQGRMVATWFQAPAAEFIARSRRAFEGGMKGAHMLGGSSIDVAGERAIAQTRMQIVQRGALEGVEVDVTCWGRFFDFFEKLDGAWKLWLRQPIYDLDRMSVVDPSASLPPLDPAVLERFPEGYRHLAYLQSTMGFDVARDLPGTRGPAMDALTARGQAWLAGTSQEP